MEKIIEFITEKAYNEAIAFLFLIGGMILGVVTVIVVYKLFAIKKRDKKTPLAIRDITQIKNEAVAKFEYAETGFEKEKLTVFFESLNVLLKYIPIEYNPKTRLYDIIDGDTVKFLESGLKTSLDFTVYELVWFIRIFAEELHGVLRKLIESKGVKAVYGVGRFATGVMVKEKLDTDPEEVKIAQIVEVLGKFKNKFPKKPTEAKNESKIKKVFSPVIEKIKEVAKDVALGFVTDKASDLADNYIVEIIEIFAEELNLLYSGNISERIVPKDSNLAVLEKEGA